MPLTQEKGVANLISGGAILAAGSLAIAGVSKNIGQLDASAAPYEEDSMSVSTYDGLNKDRSSLIFNKEFSTFTGQVANASLTIDPSLKKYHHKKHHPKKHYVNIQPLPPILREIGGCESAGSKYAKINYTAQNPYSSANGGFQVTHDTWNNFAGYPEAKEAPPSVQNQEAEKLLKERGTEPWASSQSCWGQ